jgi:hypothetical protein
MSFGKGLILKLVVSQGTKTIKAKLKSGELKETDLVDIESELATAKVSIGAAGATVGITDDDLRKCIRQIASNCNLGVKK